MFCPGCGTENNVEQSYCRLCGMTLLGARLSLEGRMDEAVTKLRKGIIRSVGPL